MTYTGREVKPHISISYQGCELTDYTVEYNNNVAPGKANVVVYGNNNLMGNKRVYFQIRRSLDGATVTLDKTQYTYSAAEIRPNVTVVLDGTTLQQGTDYTVSYADNTNVGTAKVTVSGAGNYTGTLTASFKILPAPVVKNGWQKEGGKWYYYNNNVKQTGWKKIGGKWYLFAYAGGQMLTGWVKSGGKWYYFNSSGAMVTGWQKISGVWYYFNASGAMVTGWQKISGKWYYFNSSGSMRTANLKQGNKTYRFASSGACLNP